MGYKASNPKEEDHLEVGVQRASVCYLVLDIGIVSLVSIGALDPVESIFSNDRTYNHDSVFT